MTLQEWNALEPGDKIRAKVTGVYEVVAVTKRTKYPNNLDVDPGNGRIIVANDPRDWEKVDK